MKHGMVAILAVSILAMGLPDPGQTKAQGQPASQAAVLPYGIVDTGQKHIFGDRGQLLKAPQPGEPFFGQDAFYQGSPPRYRDNKDGTISDLNTGLMWLKTPLEDRKLLFAEARNQVATCRLAGRDDWRLPTIKELYSLIDFNGNSRAAKPTAYIDTKYFDFRFGDESKGERIIDSQYWSSTEYVGRTMRDNATVFGVNFADGRIKGYPRDTGPRGEPAAHYVLLVRGNAAYGKNRFVDNKEGTISDLATGLMWTRADSGKAMDWRDALAWCEGLELAGHDDWRLPNAKELQSLVDYTRAPDAISPAQRGPAIDPIFQMTDGESWFWTSTTHLEGPGGQGAAAVYIAFGRAMGTMRGRTMNVHGAGAQRSDPKSGDPKDPRWARGMGPQGDEIRILNYARAVRSLDPATVQRVEPNLAPLPEPPFRGPPGGREGPPDRLGPPPGRRPPPPPPPFGPRFDRIPGGA